MDGFVKKFYEKPDFCKDMCDSCGYCESYARKCMESKQVEELNAKALSFYRNIDGYTEALKNYQGTQQKKLIDEGELNLDFDF